VVVAVPQERLRSAAPQQQPLSETHSPFLRGHSGLVALEVMMVVVVVVSKFLPSGGGAFVESGQVFFDDTAFQRLEGIAKKRLPL